MTFSTGPLPDAHVEHIGSLLRPKFLLEAREKFATQQCSAEDVKAAEDAAIADAVKLQKELGFKTITDGEFRRTFFYEGMFDKLDGMSLVPNRSLSTCRSYVPYIQVYQAMGLAEIPSVFTTGKIRRTTGIHTDDFEYLKSLVEPDEVKNLKITIISPTWLHLRHGSQETYDLSIYKNDDEYFADLVQAYREEINALYDLGCRHIQIDDPIYCFFCSESMTSGMRAAGEDPEALLTKYIDVYNEIMKGRPADLTVGVHMCRGNYRGMHYCEGGYEPIAETIFKKLNVDRFCLEYDTERAGGLEPLRYLPSGKVVVLGLVSTKKGTLETPEDLKDRVEQAVNAIIAGPSKPSKEDVLKQICISPQCGFASTVEGNPITEEDQRRKLALIMEAARLIWAS